MLICTQKLFIILKFCLKFFILKIITEKYAKKFLSLHVWI